MRYTKKENNKLTENLGKKGEIQMNQCQHHSSDGTDVKKLCISMVPIFNHLQSEEMLEIAKTSRSLTFKKGETVFEAGESSDYLYIVHKGQVKIYRLSESGKEQLIRIMGQGDFMGELSLFTDESLTNRNLCDP